MKKITPKKNRLFRFGSLFAATLFTTVIGAQTAASDITLTVPDDITTSESATEPVSTGQATATTTCEASISGGVRTISDRDNNNKRWFLGLNHGGETICDKFYFNPPYSLRDPMEFVEYKIAITTTGDYDLNAEGVNSTFLSSYYSGVSYTLYDQPYDASNPCDGVVSLGSSLSELTNSVSLEAGTEYTLVLQPYYDGYTTWSSFQFPLRLSYDLTGTSPIQITHSDNRVGDVITRTFTAIDYCGNSSMGTQSITVLSSPFEYESFPDDVTVQCGDLSIAPDANGEYSSADLQALVDAELSAPTVVNGPTCGTTPALTYTDSFNNSPTGDKEVAVITRTYGALTNDCGQMLTERSVTVTIEDNDAPTFVGQLDDVDARCGENATASTPEVEDCDPNVTITSSDQDVTADAQANDPSVINSILRTYTATDASGNSATATQTITYRDTQAPTFDGYADRGPYYLEPGEETYAVGVFIFGFEDACTRFTLTSDAPSDDSYVYYSTNYGAYTGFITIEGDYPEGFHTVVVTATDEAGNSRETYVTFEVIQPNSLEVASTYMEVSIDYANEKTTAPINFPFVASTCDTTPQGDQLNGYQYIGYFQGSHYYVSNSESDWAIANRNARELGGELASISNSDENRFLMDHLDADGAWVGLSSFGKHDQQFSWDDGSSYSNWAAGNPVTDFYNVFGYLDGSTGELKNDDLSLRPYIVEFKPFQFWTPPFGKDDELSLGVNTRVIKVMDECGNVNFAVQQINVSVETVDYCNPRDVTGAYTLTDDIDGYSISAIRIGDSEYTYDSSSPLLSADSAEFALEGPVALEIETTNENVDISNEVIYYRAWIDYNQDGDFYDIGELVFERQGYPEAANFGNFGITDGPTRMRVAVSRYSYPEPCGINPLGATQDLTINITSAADDKNIIVLGARALGSNVYLTTDFVEDATVDRYILLRGTTANNLSKLKVWNADFNDGVKAQYTQVDQSPLTTGFYQVYAVSVDGQILKRSEVVSATVTATRGSVSVFPNPARENAKLEIKGRVSDYDGNVVVIDAFGRVVTEMTWPAGEQVLDLRLPQVATGTYYLQVAHPDAPVQTLSLFIDQEMGSLLRP